MTIAVDFDGTIVDHKYPAIGRERSFAIATLLLLQEEGHRLILWTAREGRLLDEAVEFCRSRGLEFFAVNSNFPEEVAPRNGTGPESRSPSQALDRLEGGDTSGESDAGRREEGRVSWTPACRKLKADLFIDDRSLGGLVDWVSIREIVRNHWTWEDYYSRVYSAPPKPRGLFGRLFGGR